MQKWLKFVLISVSVMLLASGCGDDGGGDTTKPIITLKGSATMALNVGDTYTDAGATATDDVDGDITDQIVTLSDVNTSRAGTYHVTYNVKDTAGNAADEVTRTVTVTAPPPPADTTAPVFTSAATASVPENQTSAITLAATDETSTVTYAISGTDAASFDLDAESGVVTFKSAPDFESGKTSYSFTAKATDAANNTATQNVTITITDDNCTDGDEVWHLGVMYCPVTSPYGDKRVWLDRNVGAAKVCDKSRGEFDSDAAYVADQQACFGDYYQWGRNTDGHEKKESNTTDVLAASVDNVDHGDFIINSSSPYDWAADTVDNNGSKRLANWSDTHGNSICPVGYRVATLDELKAELFDTNSSEIQKDKSEKESNSDDRRVNAYNTFLKLPSAGLRSYDSGTLDGQGDWGDLWVATAEGSGASYVYVNVDDAGSFGGGYRADGLSVRCLRDNP